MMKTFKQMYYEDGHTAVAKTNTAQKRELDRLKIKHDREDDRARTQDTARKNQQTEAPSLAVLKKKIKSGTKLGSTETARCSMCCTWIDDSIYGTTRKDCCWCCDCMGCLDYLEIRIS